MKKQFLKLGVVALAIFATSCKSEKKNETVASQPETAAEATADAVKYTAMAEESSIEWKGFKPTGTHTGTIGIKGGEIMADGTTPESGMFVIDMNSITVTDLEAGDGKEDLEAHLKGNVEGKEDHFFNVAEHPEAKFELTGITTVEGKTNMQGNLTIKGNTNNIEFPVTITNEGDTMVISSETFTIDRTNWNVNYGSKSVFDDLGDKFINDEIELNITVKAKKS